MPSRWSLAFFDLAGVITWKVLPAGRWRNQTGVTWGGHPGSSMARTATSGWARNSAASVSSIARKSMLPLLTFGSQWHLPGRATDSGSGFIARIAVVLTYGLSSRDLEEVRFAVSPVAEMVLSLRALRDPGRFPLQLGWVRGVQPVVEQVDWSVLRWLVNDTMGSPDFLTPRPTSPLTQIQDELEIIGAVDRGTFERQLVAVNKEVPDELAGADGPARVVDALRAYWQCGDGAVLGSDADDSVGRHQLSRACADPARDRGDAERTRAGHQLSGRTTESRSGQ